MQYSYYHMLSGPARSATTLMSYFFLDLWIHYCYGWLQMNCLNTQLNTVMMVFTTYTSNMPALKSFFSLSVKDFNKLQV